LPDYREIFENGVSAVTLVSLAQYANDLGKTGALSVVGFG
jgi:hypothetical protein